MGESPEGASRVFVPFFTAQATTAIGSAVAQFALVWWLTSSVRNPATALATATLTSTLPGIVLGPMVGALVDRGNRRRIVMLADGAIALTLLGLTLLWTLKLLAPWHLFVAMALRGLAGTFQYPAVQALTPRLVAPEHLTRVAGLQQMVQSATIIAAPPLGALLTSVMPLGWILALPVGASVLAICLTLLVPAGLGNTIVASGDRKPPSLWADLKEGLRYVVGWPALLICMFLGTVLNMILTPAFALMPVYVRKELHGGAPLLAGIESSFGFGGLAGGALLGAWGGFPRKMATSMLGLGIMGVGILLVGLATRIGNAAGFVGMALLGVGAPICNGPIMAVVQSAVAPNLMGRVMTFMGSISSGAAPLALAVSGPLADRFGVAPGYIAGGVACLLAGLALPVLPTWRLEEEGKVRGAVTPR
ncbi:MAG: MFS transporter [Armatimonas sp.]